MYVGRDFDPSDTGEDERYSFDFVNDLKPGDSIASVVWACGVAPRSEVADSNAPASINGPPVFTGTKTTQRVSGLLPGVIYTLTATVVSTDGDTVSLWSHVECKEHA